MNSMWMKLTKPDLSEDQEWKCYTSSQSQTSITEERLREALNGRQRGNFGLCRQTFRHSSQNEKPREKRRLMLK